MVEGSDLWSGNQDWKYNFRSGAAQGSVCGRVANMDLRSGNFMGL